MRSTTLIFGISQFLTSASATTLNYALIDTYVGGASFFDRFSFITGNDGTGGFADYQTRDAAGQLGIISSTSKSAIFGADHNATVDRTSAGRPSVRLEGTTKYNKGLIVADIQHMPGTACGSWPAFWSFGDTWPDDGEIDIIEGVNKNTQNKYSLHSGVGTCVITDEGSSDKGTVAATDCHTEAADGTLENFVGCGIDSGISSDFGDGFNSNGGKNNGGFYVTQWTDSFIKMWYFPRGSEPASLSCDVPDYRTFGTPDAWFSGCDFGSKFKNQHLVFTTNFCGSYAGANGVYDTSGCPLPVGPVTDTVTADINCREQVGQNPGDYVNQYWEVNSIKVYGETSVAPNGFCGSSSSSSRISSSTSSKASSSTSSKASTSTHSTFSTYSASNSSATFHFPSNGPGSSGPKVTNSAGGEGSEGSWGASITGSSSKPSPSDFEGHPVWGNNGFPEGCSPIKVPVRTVITTEIVDVCPAGLTTSTLTTTGIYCPMCHEQSDRPGWGFTETVKVCSTGCGPKPVTVTVTLPATDAGAWAIKTSNTETSYSSTGTASWGAKPAWVVSSTPAWATSTAAWATSVAAAAVPNKSVAPVWAASSSAIAGAAKPVANATATYTPQQVTKNAATTTFASAIVMIGAAIAAVMML